MIRELAYGKINLVLDVVSKREDGYHNLKMIMIPIELHDTLEFELADKDTISSNVEIKNNSMYDAIDAIKIKYNIKMSVHIKLDKKIPIGAGLGGGSADIAATIRGLKRLWKLDITESELEELALDLGSDTLFCLYNKPAYVYGRGEHLLFVNLSPIENIYLITSNISVSTKKIFSNYKIRHKPKRFDRLFRYYLNEKYTQFLKKSYNDLTKTTLKNYPDLKQTVKRIKKTKQRYLMSGSGATFYVLALKGKSDNLEEKLVKNKLSYIKTTPKA